MATPRVLEDVDWDLFDLMFGDHGIAYEPGTTLGDRAWILAETVRRRFEKAGYVVRGQHPFLPKHVKQIVDKREGEKGGFFGPGGIGHGSSP